MRGEDVVELYRALNVADVRVWVDGGWCVDALVGRQTREHSDLDIAVDRRDVGSLMTVLGRLGFECRTGVEENFVLADGAQRRVDVHVFEFDEAGAHIYGVEYPRESLTGRGTIGDQDVDCITAAWMYRFKTAYEPAAKDLRDIAELRALITPDG